MFSRSEKTDEVIDPMAEPSGQRSPMVLAALAGLLAIAGAFLLVWYLSNGDDEVASPNNADGTESSGEATSQGSEADKQVLVVTASIPRGTTVSELIAAPTVYLTARTVPEQFVAASAITSVAELQELEGLVLASEALPGEQLLRGRFRDPSDFESNTDTFLEAQTEIEIPEGHHAVVLELPSTRALGGLLRKGELVTVIMSARLNPTQDGEDAREVSLVALNSVEVLNVDSSLEVAGQVASDFDSVGIANRGSFTVTLAVEPDELTDLTFAISYGEITLATAVAGMDNEDSPRAATWMRQMVGDDGIWLEELEDGNVIGLVELFGAANEEATSIEIEAAGDDDTESVDDTENDLNETVGDS